MPLSRTAKQEIVARYQKGLANALTAFLVDYRGISVPEITELRRRIREHGGSYEVIKNRLALLALKGTALEELSQHLQGPTAIAYSDGDAVGLAKVLAQFAKDVPAVEFKVGLVDGQRVGAEEIKQIATLPSRQELIARLVFLLQSPTSRFVRSLAAIPQQFVAVVGQIQQQREKQV